MVSLASTLRIAAVTVLLFFSASGQGRPIEYDDPLSKGEVIFVHEFDFLGEFASLPRVTVIGYRNWTIVCSGSDCSDYFQLMADAALSLYLLRQIQLSPEQLAAVSAFSACSASPRITPATRQTTSHEQEPTLRWSAATNIIDAAIGQRSLGMNGRTVTVMYSDGGTERFVYATAASTHGAIPGSLVVGSGVAGSACRGAS